MRVDVALPIPGKPTGQERHARRTPTNRPCPSRARMSTGRFLYTLCICAPRFLRPPPDIRICLAPQSHARFNNKRCQDREWLAAAGNARTCLTAKETCSFFPVRPLQALPACFASTPSGRFLFFDSDSLPRAARRPRQVHPFRPRVSDRRRVPTRPIPASHYMPVCLTCMILRYERYAIIVTSICLRT